MLKYVLIYVLIDTLALIAWIFFEICEIVSYKFLETSCLLIR
jgi:hypothetical protein